MKVVKILGEVGAHKDLTSKESYVTIMSKEVCALTKFARRATIAPFELPNKENLKQG